jgi:hypothetical protein
MADRFDLDAIEADDALLDLLAAGGESAWAAAEHDPALMLLADLRLAVEVEDELPVETIDDPESFLARCAALNPVTDPFARKMAARGLALGIAAVAALSVSGVAAAVTGDPLSPYEEVIKKVVDAVRPETSSPMEQLDGLGLPVADKTKIVKVAKDYQKKQEEAKAADDKAAEERLNGPTALPADMTTVAPPPLARPPVAQAPTKVEQPLSDPVTENPVGQPTTDPTTDPSSDPSTPPSTDPSTPPSSDPTDPPPSSEPSTPPSSDPTNPQTQDPTTPPPTDTGSSENGDGGGNPGPPSTVPSNGGGETGTGDTGTGTGDTGTGDTGIGTGADQTAPSDQTGDEPAASTPVEEAVDEIVPVLPTPTGEPAEPTRLAEYLAKSVDEAQAKHSSGKPAVGYAKSQYAKGKHSTGQYAEGKHAAIARAHGSMAPMTLRQILTVLNGPMGAR